MNDSGCRIVADFALGIDLAPLKLLPAPLRRRETEPVLTWKVASDTNKQHATVLLDRNFTLLVTY